MAWILTAVAIIILSVGFYFWRKKPSRAARIVVAGLVLVACVILWRVSFAPNAPVKLDGADDQSQSQPQSNTQITVAGRSSGTSAPATPVAKPGPDKNTAQAIAEKTPQRDASRRIAPISDPIETTHTATEPESAILKTNDEQLDALIGDATSVNPEGSTIVDTIVKKGRIQEPNRNTPSEDDYSFPAVINGPDGIAMIIPDEPLPSLSSRRQLTTGDGDIPGPGEVVALTYDMFSWSTGEMVESSQTALKSPLMYRLGGKDTPIGIPRYLDEAVRNRPYGSTVQVVFEKEMPDLPGYLNPNDGYVLVVRVDKPDMDNETALEMMNDAMKQ